jgi:hypothetical protein
MKKMVPFLKAQDVYTNTQGVAVRFRRSWGDSEHARRSSERQGEREAFQNNARRFRTGKANAKRFTQLRGVSEDREAFKSTTRCVSGRSKAFQKMARRFGRTSQSNSFWYWVKEIANYMMFFKLYFYADGCPEFVALK